MVIKIDQRVKAQCIFSSAIHFLSHHKHYLAFNRPAKGEAVGVGKRKEGWEGGGNHGEEGKREKEREARKINIGGGEEP